MNVSGAYRDVGRQSALVTDRAIFRLIVKDAVHIGGDDDKGRRGAHEQGVNIDGKGLDKALLGRVGNLGGSGCLWSSALTGLIGVDAAANAPHNGHAEHAGKASLHIESGAEDEGEHLGDLVEVHNHDDDGQDNIDDRHNRNHQRSKVRNTLDAADNNDCQNRAENHGGDGEVNIPGIVDRGGNTVGLDTWQEVAGCQDHGNSKDDGVAKHERRRGGVLIGLFDIVGRAAAVFTGVLVSFFVNLGQRTFDE